jgi:IS5 family transposase
MKSADSEKEKLKQQLMRIHQPQSEITKLNQRPQAPYDRASDGPECAHCDRSRSHSGHTLHLDFLRFLGLTPEGKIPDAKTIWLFREALKEKGWVDKLFAELDAAFTERGFRAQKGMVIDARIVEVPKQRNSRKDHDLIKEGLMPADWRDEPAKARQKDLDARWTKKHGKSYYGYKNHVNVDVKHKLIRRYQVSPADVHDSQKLKALLDPGNTLKTVWADSAYRSRESDTLLKKRAMVNRIHYRAWRDGELAAW